jgi:orotate phosphoribosyltransferase
MNSKNIAKQLIENDIIQENNENGFVLSNGSKSNIYLDCRKIASLVNLRKEIVDELVREINRETSGVESICGVATGSVPLAMLVANQMRLPFIYHRIPKDYGLSKRIEGIYHDNQKIVVIEDVVTTGMSAIRAVIDLESEKLNVLGLFSIYAGKEIGFVENFVEHEINFFPLTTWLDVDQYYKNKY